MEENVTNFGQKIGPLGKTSYGRVTRIRPFFNKLTQGMLGGEIKCPNSQY